MRPCLSFIFCFILCLIVTTVHAAEVELLHDQWGVPHIFAESDEGAMYGLGYACAQDRGFQMTLSLRTIQGRLAETIGDRKHQNRDRTTIELDKKMRILGFYRAAKQAAQNLDAESTRLLQAYSDGVNAYFNTHKQDLHPLFAKLGVKTETWTPADSIACWWNIGRFFATEGLNDAMQYYKHLAGTRGAMPRGGFRGMGREQSQELERRMKNAQRVFDDGAAVVKREDVSDEWIDEVNAFLESKGFPQEASVLEDGPKFSHAWAVGGDLTTTGSSVLCSDPQTPVRNPSLFYEFHIKGKTFNARGVGVPGSPIILIGWNEHVSWGATALGADQADQFKLVTSNDPEKENQYYFDGEWRDLRVIKETIKVKDGAPVELTVRESHLGPIVSDIAPTVKAGDWFTMKRVPVCETDRETIQAAIKMMRAQNVNEFFDALSDWRFPSLNSVFADADGGVGYSLGAAIPIRSASAIDGGAVAHDGSSSTYDWQGYAPQRLLPHVLNPKRGYVYSGNHRPIGSFYPAPVGISTGSGGDTTRSWRLRERLEAKSQFTPQDVLDIHYDSVNAPKRTIIQAGYYLRDELKHELPAPALAALEYLEPWYESGAVINNASPGTELVGMMSSMFRIIQTPLAAEYGGGQSGLCLYLKTLQSRMEQKSKTAWSKDEIGFIEQTLSNAWRQANQRFGGDPQQWHANATQRANNQRLGYFDTLDGFGSLDRAHDLTAPALRNTDGETIFSQMAQSYTQWVPMHDVDGAQSLLPIGNSERIDSPFRTATMGLWQSGAMHPAPLSREKVEPYVKETEILQIK
ncbi:MAG: penicillin acylase family protein [Candidatus Hinthialibacter antarcticus]|nr:penicillin acylase family protein [Candidatus Hinthialibacter antarcticus]